MGVAAYLRENVVYRTIEYISLAIIGIGLNIFFVIHIFSLAIGHYNHSNISVSGDVTDGILGLLLGTVIALRALDMHLLPKNVSFLGIYHRHNIRFGGHIVVGKMDEVTIQSSKIHIWHHAYHLPKNPKFGANFGLSLSIGDYIN